MSQYQILTDSTCDFPNDLYAQLNLAVVPLTVRFRQQEQNDTNDDSLRAMYEGLRAGETATTSAINPQRWASAMEPYLKDGKDLLVMTFSSGLSTTYQSAVIAAEELREAYPQRTIHVVDTLAASLGEGLLVLHACRLRDSGMDLGTLHAWVEENKLHLCHWFTVDDLMYLKRGGRISPTTALVGTMLQIKPVLHVDNEGHLVNVAKSRGRKAAIHAMVEKMEKTMGSFDNTTVAISHGDCREDAEELASLLKERFGVQEVLISYVGAVIGSHSGPGTLALFFLGNQR